MKSLFHSEGNEVGFSLSLISICRDLYVRAAPSVSSADVNYCTSTNLYVRPTGTDSQMDVKICRCRDLYVRAALSVSSADVNYCTSTNLYVRPTGTDSQMDV